MANRSRMATRQPHAEETLRALGAIGAGRKATDRRAASSTLWRQIDRWVNEGGALGDGTGPTASEGI